VPSLRDSDLYHTFRTLPCPATAYSVPSGLLAVRQTTTPLLFASFAPKPLLLLRQKLLAAPHLLIIFFNSITSICFGHSGQLCTQHTITSHFWDRVRAAGNCGFQVQTQSTPGFTSPATEPCAIAASANPEVNCARSKTKRSWKPAQPRAPLPQKGKPALLGTPAVPHDSGEVSGQYKLRRTEAIAILVLSSKGAFLC
jgi:hypothetical protein